MSVSTVQSVEPRPLDQGIRTTIARTPDEAEALRPWFERLQPRNLDADLDFFLTVSRMSETVLRPHIVLCELPDDRAILVVGRVEQQRPSGRLGRRGVRTLRLAFGGVVGADTADDCRVVVEALGGALADGEADAVLFPQLEFDGPLHAAVRSATPWWRADHMPRRHTHWRADVPDSLEAFLRARSAKTRSNLRYYRKKVCAAHGADLSVREFRDPVDLHRLCEDFESTAAMTYQRGLGVGYTGDPLQVALMTLAAQRGWLRAWVLYLAEIPVAYWFGYCYNGAFSSVANGFNPAYSDLRIGQYLQIEVIDSLCNEPDVRTFDWGTGEAEYKRRFGDRVVAEADVLLYAASVRAARLNAARTARVAATRLARAWIARTQLGARAKKIWRTRAEIRAKSRVA